MTKHHLPDGAFALAYTDLATHLHHYIPTAPEARSWRGPFASWDKMVRALADELGNDLTIHTTTIRPEHLG